MIYNVYGLVSPIDGQVVSVGMTTYSIEHRLKQHYWHLNEVNRGERKNNKSCDFLMFILHRDLRDNIVRYFVCAVK